jgi:hypothetical protein
MQIRLLKSKTSRDGSTRRGIALAAVVVLMCIFTILGFSVLNMAKNEAVLTQNAIDRTKAFYLAEAGLSLFTAGLGQFGTVVNVGDIEDIEDTALGEGSYGVVFYEDEDPPYAVATGIVGNEEKKIKVEVAFLAAPYEHAIYAGGLSGANWSLALRGKGNPQAVGGGREVGGRDIIKGNIYVDGDVVLYEESSINPAPAPNTYGLNGDVDATGNINVLDSASISGEALEGVELQDAPDLLAMHYETNNTHNVSQIFADKGIEKGRLPSGHSLYDVVVKNPADRSTECASTVGDDYFLEPAHIGSAGTKKGGGAPLHLGDNRVYYIDGNVWIHNKSTYGFLVDGNVTIVATGNIHISDNTEYANSESVLGLVALGKYDSENQLVSGGNIFFGDPRYGTMYTVAGLMFAANNFLYNTESPNGSAKEPESGFSVYGNFTALNRVSVNRDWYSSGGTGEARAAYFEPSAGSGGGWVDMNTGAALTAAEIGSLRHYQMQVNYDDRVRTLDTQPPGLPRGQGSIISGLTDWEELP